MTDLVSVNEKVLRINGIPYQKGTLFVRINAIVGGGGNYLTFGSTSSGETYSGTHDQFSNNGNPFATDAAFLAYVEVNFFRSITNGGGEGGVITNSTINEIPIGILNGANSTFYSTSNFIPESMQVYLNGLRLNLLVDYNTNSNNTIILNVSPVSTEILAINYIKQ